ncbi:hypothetical protein CGLO_05440 [Colletotrichum gloeosporioides Cg-14]|uniref:Ankyrin n=1 Tax=Colletotrichum gloeosporioides (strain Cg-14) TaxID=1237896 RepID=T0KGX8_COLGC|nr:hypothetical protein CGLO_05440 [Colletotrichum gloeosporioides Cg-14]
MTNKKGIDPLQCWDWSTDDMENPATSKLESFDAVAHLLADHGARCDLHDPDRRTALHLHIAEPFRMRAMLKYQPTESVEKAMETMDNDGYTPLTLSLWKMLALSASILLAQQTTITAKTTQSPIAALSLAVRAGDETSFDALLQSGISFSFEDTETLLHHLGPQTSLHLVRRLKALYPESSGHRFNSHTPLESYLICCLETSGVRGINDSIIDELAILDSFESEFSKAMTWECFMSRILSSTLHLPRSWTGIREDLAEKDDRQVISENASTDLIRLGYLKSFESCFGKSGIIPLMHPFSTLKELSKPWSRLKDLVSEVLRQTQHWDSLREFPGIIFLLQVAAHSYNFRNAKLLLQNGVSVHQRVDGLSALESFVKTPRLDGLMHACSAKSEDTDDEENYCAKRMLDLLLRHSDKARINEVIPDGSGLAHLPNAWGAEWVIEKIVDHGANPNLRVDKHPYRPAAVYQFFEHRWYSGYVKTILKKGADPTLTDDFGFDTALIAAMCRAVPVLTEIYDDIKQGAKKDCHDRIDWCKKCSLFVDLENMSLLCKGVTALHLGALCQSTDVLCFCNDHKLMEDLEVRSDEGFTPLHFAASQGRVSNIKYLSALGCDIDARGKDGSCPLHLAARSNKIEACRVLIKAGCKSFEDSVGMTPALYARQASNEELANLLDTVKSGSSVTHVEIERRRKRSLALSFKVAIEKDDLTMSAHYWYKP